MEIHYRCSRCRIVLFWLLGMLLMSLAGGACGATTRRAPQAPVAAPLDPLDLGAGIQQIVAAAPNTPTDGRSPWLGQAAWEQGTLELQAYIQSYGTEPRERFTYSATLGDLGQVWLFMQGISAGLGVSCQYCHDFSDRCANDWRFGDVDTAQMAAAQQMLGLVQTINTRLQAMPGWSGALVTCGTCHQGQPLPPITGTAATAQSDATAHPLRDGRGEPLPTGATALTDRAAFCQSMLAELITSWDHYGALPDYQTGARRYPTCATCHLGYATPPSVILPDDLDTAHAGATLLPPVLRGE